MTIGGTSQEYRRGATRGVSGSTFSFLYREVVTQIYSAKMKTLACFISCLVCIYMGREPPVEKHRYRCEFSRTEWPLPVGDFPQALAGRRILSSFLGWIIFFDSIEGSLE